MGYLVEPFTPFERALRKREQRWKRSASETPAAHLGAPAQGELFSIPGHAPPVSQPYDFTDVKVEGDVITGNITVRVTDEQIQNAYDWVYRGAAPACETTLEALLGATILEPSGLPIVVDDSIPPDTLELRSPGGRLLGAIAGIGWDPGEPPEWTTEEIPE